MKAIEYFEQYGEAVFAEAMEKGHGDKALSDLMLAFVREMKDLIKSRNVQSNRGTVGVIREMNEKWNALVAIFEKHKGDSPIRRNGFRLYMELEIPELKNWKG